MAIAGVENQGSATSLSELRALQQERQQQTEEVEQRQETIATGQTGAAPETEETDGAEGGENPFGAGASQAGAAQTGASQTGGAVLGGGLDDQSLGALIQATQQQNDQANVDAVVTEAEENANEDELQQQLTAGNATNSLAPGFNNGGANNPQGVSVVV